MAITKVSNSSLKNLNKYDSFLAGNAAYDPGATFLIQRVNGTGSSSSITFSSIPSTYKHLQIRMSAINSSGSLYIRVNGDTGTNYSRHYLYGNGSAVAAAGAASSNLIYLNPNGGNTTSPQGGIIDIQEYANTSMNKTVRAFIGVDMNGSGSVWLASGAWLSTSAVNSLTLAFDANNILTGSTFALYGLKG
jgi:hypothetical protein